LPYDNARVLLLQVPLSKNTTKSFFVLRIVIKSGQSPSIDESRLQYIIQNQKNLRMESIQGISDIVTRGHTNGNEIGRRVILPASYVGGRRYMFQNYHDGLTIYRVYGPPDFFCHIYLQSKLVRDNIEFI
jgi:hypothetical protein